MLNDTERAACCGAGTYSDGDMEECRECGRRVVWDLVDSGFFGFASSGCQVRGRWLEEQRRRAATGTNATPPDAGKER